MTDIVGIDTIIVGNLPAQTANYDSLADHAAKTQSDWENQLATAEETRWGSDGVLGGLFQGLAQGKPFVTALIEAVIHEVFEDVSDFFEDVGDAFLSLGSNFNGKWRDILNAKNAADFANAQLAVINRPIRELFDGAAGNLPSRWTVTYFDFFAGLGGGLVQQDGKGNAWWNAFGIVGRGARCRYNAVALTSDDQAITIVMPLAVQAPILGTLPSHTRVLLRMNSAGNSYLYAQVGYNEVEIGCVNSGSETVFASTGTATQNSDVWDFTAIGTLLTLARNGIDILTYDDTGAVSQVGSSYRYVGFEFFAEGRSIFGQTSPGTIAVLSADDL
jgi:hypothetical protein